jgi:UDP-GlcNAc:undecaprenyl-phosphate GlcNAc-1-phosphate transferase
MLILKIILAVASTFLFVNFSVPIVSKIAIYIGAVDKPNNRKVHKHIMPSMGGLAIFIGFLFGFIIFGEKSLDMIAILIGVFIIILTGVIDDIIEIKAKYKALAQTVAALIIVFYGGIYFNFVDLPFGGPLNLYWLGALFSIFWIVGITNAVNLIDGLDGLAAGVSSIFFFTIGIIGLGYTYIQHSTGALVTGVNENTAMLAFIMLGSTLGFLRHNFHPAKIFMGDTGSLFLGFMISVIALLGFKKATAITLLAPLLVLAVPILDTLFAILRRLLKGQSIGEADKQHLHHQLMSMQLGHRDSVITIYLISGLFSTVAIVYSTISQRLGLYLLIVVSLLVIWFIEKTDILSESYSPISNFLDRLKKKKKSKKNK